MRSRKTAAPPGRSSPGRAESRDPGDPADSPGPAESPGPADPADRRTAGMPCEPAAHGDGLACRDGADDQERAGSASAGAGISSTTGRLITDTTSAVTTVPITMHSA